MHFDSKKFQKIFVLPFVLSGGIGLGFAGIGLASSVAPAPKTVEVKGSNVQQVELGVWQVDVDTDNPLPKIKQISGKPGIKVAALLGPGAGAINSALSASTVYDNTSVVTVGGNQFATASTRFTITNNTGATLGQSTSGVTTGVRLLLIPIASGSTTTSTCPTATTLARPICLLTSTITGTTPGPSGNTDGTDQVFMVPMSDRTGATLSVAANPDATNPPEQFEATGFASATSFARTIWQSNLTIPSGGTADFGFRTRYAQQGVISANPPRVRSYRYFFRLVADRPTGATASTSTANSYVTTTAGNGTVPADFGVPGTVGATAGPSQANFRTVRGVVTSPNGRTLYAVSGNSTTTSRLLSIDLATGTVTNLLNATTSTTVNPLNNPRNIAINSAGNRLYIADININRVLSIDLTANPVTSTTQNLTVGGATLSPAQASTRGVAVRRDPVSGNEILYIAETQFSGLANNIGRILSQRLNADGTFNGDVTIFDPATVVAAVGPLLRPAGVAVNPAGTIVYVADTNNNRILAMPVNPATGALSGTVSAVLSTQLSAPSSLVVSNDGNTIYVINPSEYITNTTGVPANTDGNRHTVVAVPASCNNTCTPTVVAGVPTTATPSTTASVGGFIDGSASGSAPAQLNQPDSITINPSGSILYVGEGATVGSATPRIRQIQAIEGLIP